MADLIDRAEAQTELQFAFRRYNLSHEAHGEGRVVWSENLVSVSDAMNALRKVPGVDAVPVVHGHWERKYSRPGVYADLLWHCSVCGAKFRDNWADHYKRCPECGAFMDGKDEA